jgi:hypothetical protein
MKLTVVVLCAVLCFVDGGVAQESDWLSGTWKGIRKLESASNPTYFQRQALNSPGSETGLCRKFCSGSREGAVAPLCRGIKRPGSRTIRPQ